MHVCIFLKFQYGAVREPVHKNFTKWVYIAVLRVLRRDSAKIKFHCPMLEFHRAKPPLRRQYPLAAVGHIIS